MSLLLRDEPSAGVLRLTLNRPEARNALNIPLREELAAAFVEADADPAVRCIVVVGSGKAFSAGADLKLLAPQTPIGMDALALQKLWRPIADFSKPFIAAVGGYAIGAGCELALHADIIVAGRSAGFGLAEIKVGIIPGAGGTQRLVRAVGKYRAMRMLMTGEIIRGPLAAEWGLVSDLVEDGEVETKALDYATRLAEGPLRALQAVKEVVLRGPDLPLDSALTLERRTMQLLFDTRDQKEGMNAFIESRPAKFD